MTRSKVKRSFLFLSILFPLSTIWAQKIYIVDNFYMADVKVYKVGAAHKADLWVFKVNTDHKVRGNNGRWYFTNVDYKADKKVFFVDADYKADVIIYFTDKEYKAGWNKRINKFWFD